jgi:nicotinate-nucleotide adenylyltransferase
MKIAYFGFAANPPHLGHLKVIEWLSTRYDLVLVGPSAAHAFGKNLPPMVDRLPLVHALLAGSVATNVTVTDIEMSLVGTGSVYSHTVLCALRTKYPEATLHLAIGPDNAEPSVWQKFYRADEIVRDFGLVVAPDMGPDRRSTYIRKLMASGATLDALTPLTGLAVATLLMAQLGLRG